MVRIMRIKVGRCKKISLGRNERINARSKIWENKGMELYSESNIWSRFYNSTEMTKITV
jgi:hypothetical protein